MANKIAPSSGSCRDTRSQNSFDTSARGNLTAFLTFAAPIGLPRRAGSRTAAPHHCEGCWLSRSRRLPSRTPCSRSSRDREQPPALNVRSRKSRSPPDACTIADNSASPLVDPSKWCPSDCSGHYRTFAGDKRRHRPSVIKGGQTNRLPRCRGSAGLTWMVELDPARDGRSVFALSFLHAAPRGGRPAERRACRSIPWSG